MAILPYTWLIYAPWYMFFKKCKESHLAILITSTIIMRATGRKRDRPPRCHHDWVPNWNLNVLDPIDDSLFTDPLYSLQSPSSAGDKIYTAGFFFWPPAQGRGGGGGQEKNRPSVDIFGSNWPCFSQEKQITIAWTAIVLSLSCQRLITLASCE